MAKKLYHIVHDVCQGQWNKLRMSHLGATWHDLKSLDLLVHPLVRSDRPAEKLRQAGRSCHAVSKGLSYWWSSGDSLVRTANVNASQQLQYPSVCCYVLSRVFGGLRWRRTLLPSSCCDVSLLYTYSPAWSASAMHHP
jgi:hypothetical protein